MRKYKINLLIEVSDEWWWWNIKDFTLEMKKLNEANKGHIDIKINETKELGGNK